MFANVVLGGVYSQDDVHKCENMYQNPAPDGSSEQPDQDGDGIGDKCELTVGSLEIEPGGEYQDILVDSHYNPMDGSTTKTYLRVIAGDQWNLAFHAWGGHSCSATGCDADLRTAVEAATCACNVRDPLAIGGWDQPQFRCNIDHCPPAKRTSPLDGDLAWNPIGGPEMDAKELIPDPHDPHVVPRYPIHSTSPDHDEIVAHKLLRDRHLAFTRYEGTSPLDPTRIVNLHRLTWPWIDAPKFRSPGVTVDYHTDAHPGQYRTTKIRMAWPQFPMPADNVPLPADLYTLSGEQHMRQNVQVFHTVTTYGLNIRTALRGQPFRDLVRGRPDPSGYRAPAYLLATDRVTAQAYLLALGRQMPRPTRIVRVQMEGSELAADARLVGLVAQMDTTPLPTGGDSGGPVSVAVVYQEAGAASAAGDQPSPARLYLGPLAEEGTAANEVVLHEISTLLGAAAAPPDLVDAQVVFVQGTSTLLLLGHTPGGDGGLIAHRLRLAGGTWSPPIPLLPRPVPGLCARLDERHGRVVIFDGAAPGGAAVHLLDLLRMTLRTLPVEAPAELARTGAACDFDPTRGLLYVYGGQAPDGTPRSDVWRLRLRTRSWTPLGDGAEPEGPGSLAEAFIYHDGERLWVSPLGVPVLGAERVPLHELGGDGTWLATYQWHEETGAASFPVTGTLLGGLPERYRYPVDEGEAWPGPLVLATLQGAPGELGLEVFGPAGDRVSESLTSVPGMVETAFRCPPGSACNLTVRRESGAGPAPYSLAARPATLVAAGEVGLAGRAQAAVLLPDGSLAAVSAAGLTLVDSESLERLSTLRGRNVGGATGVARCGSRLCVSRLGLHGLVVVDASDPAAPAVLHASVPIPLGRDVAAWGARAFVAHGILGLVRYTVSDRAPPDLAEWVWPGGRIVSVSVAAPLVAAAAADGRVHLYDASEGALRRVGLVRAGGRVSRVRFRGGMLWVRHRTGEVVEVYDVSDPAQPELVAGFEDRDGELQALYRGPWRYHLEGRQLVRQEAVQAVP